MTESPSLVPSLREIGGEHDGRTHKLALGEQVLGRDPEVSLRFEHPDVSRKHARIEVGPDGVFVNDLGSKNGVRVGGLAIDGKQRIRDGERIEIGNLVLQLDDAEGRVHDALRAAGEPTITRTRPPEPALQRPSLVLPMVAVVVFAALALALLWLG